MTAAVIPFPTNAPPVASAGRTRPRREEVARALEAIVAAVRCLSEAKVDYAALADGVEDMQIEAAFRGVDVAPEYIVGLTTQATALRGAVFFSEIGRRTGLAPLNTQA